MSVCKGAEGTWGSSSRGSPRVDANDVARAAPFASSSSSSSPRIWLIETERAKRLAKSVLGAPLLAVERAAFAAAPAAEGERCSRDARVALAEPSDTPPRACAGGAESGRSVGAAIMRGAGGSGSGVLEPSVGALLLPPRSSLPITALMAPKSKPAFATGAAVGTSTSCPPPPAGRASAGVDSDRRESASVFSVDVAGVLPSCVPNRGGRSSSSAGVGSFVCRRWKDGKWLAVGGRDTGADGGGVAFVRENQPFFLGSWSPSRTTMRSS